MIETTPEGFKILVSPEGLSVFMIDSDRVEDCICYIRKNDIRHIGINSFIGFKKADIDFLAEIPDIIEGITIAEGRWDISVINELHKLKFLGYVDNKKSIIDLSNFPGLTTLACEFSGRLLSLDTCEKLQNLTLTGFRSKDRNLTELPRLPSLIKLDLFGTNIVSFEGISRFPLLRELGLFKANHLADISALGDIKDTLTTLEFDSCRRIGSYDVLRELTNLKRLVIGNSASIPSLSFIKSLTKLEFLSFTGTDIVDGDLSPSLKIGYVGFENRRHYTHKFEDIAKHRNEIDRC